MKRMELTSFYLKLNELKEYDQAKQERQETANKTGAGTSNEKTNPYNFKWPKSEKEIRERIGLNTPDNP
jgi:hypothetical protein